MSTANIIVGFSTFAATTKNSSLTERCRLPLPQAMRTYEYFAVVELLGQPCKLKLPIRGRGMPGGVRLSPSSLFFGDVHTHAWADQLLTLSNTNTSMGARYQVRHRPKIHASTIIVH